MELHCFEHVMQYFNLSDFFMKKKSHIVVMCSVRWRCHCQHHASQTIITLVLLALESSKLLILMDLILVGFDHDTVHWEMGVYMLQYMIDSNSLCEELPCMVILFFHV